MSPHPLIGKPAPSFSLVNYNGDRYRFRPGQGTPIALFFFPKASSFGCTREACQFRDALQTQMMFKESKLQIVGVSADPVEKQARFVEKERLKYPVLSDVAGEAREAYGVGKGLLGLVNARVTFVIDASGIVQDAFESTINYSAHAKFVSKWLARSLQEKSPLDEMIPGTSVATPPRKQTIWTQRSSLEGESVSRIHPVSEKLSQLYISWTSFVDNADT